MHDIIIAGGGIAGLASAVALGRSGRKIVVLERAERLNELGAGLQIGPNAVRALEVLELWPDLKTLTVAPERITIRTAGSGRVLSTLPLAEQFSLRFGAPYRVALRDDLLQVLLNAVQDLPNVDLRKASNVLGCTGTESLVRCHLESGESVSGKLLIGADGIHSNIRQSLLGDGPPRHSGHVIYRALLNAGEVEAKVDLASVTLWLGDGGHVVHYPVAAGQKFNIVAVTESAWASDSWSIPATRDEVLHAFTGAAPELGDILRQPKHWLKWAGADRNPAPEWGRGRIALIGDAAHPVLPYLAQGAAMALEDAVTLSLELARHFTPQALRNFESRRRPRTARLLESSRRMGSIYHMKGLAALARNAVLGMTPAGASYSRLAWLYDWQAE